MKMQLNDVLLCLVFAPLLIHSFDSIFDDDVLGLIVFKAGVEDPKAKLVTWNEEDSSPCIWNGVQCDPVTKRVTSLVLDGFSLSGHVNKGLLGLKFLQILSLSNNNFTGTINPNLGHLWSLQVIDLSDNNLSGSIPEDFFKQCGSLRVVSFAKNKLTGNFPVSLSSCSTLATVNLSSNLLSGKLPSGIWFLRGLQSLDLSDNLLDGEIPEGIDNLYDLREIILQRNRFVGRLPVDFGSCLLLKWIDFSENFLSGDLPESMQRLGLCTCLSLRGNSFTGRIPDWIGELKSLEILDLSANTFSGWIPESIGNLPSLIKLNLSTNQFIGSLPESISNCGRLLVLDVSHNKFNGTFPEWICRIDVQSESSSSTTYTSFTSMYPPYRGLQLLDLSSNSFSGSLPSSISNLRSLQILNMSTNNLHGTVPAAVGELKSLYVLDLSENRLYGSIPSEIGGTISINKLILKKNCLSGEIPIEIVKCTALTSLILSQNNLTGSVPAVIANLTNLQYVDLSFNKLSGNLPKELANLSQLLHFNLSYNHLQGELPLGGYFNTISPALVIGNPSLCGSVVNRSCPSVHPKPIVLNPNSSTSTGAPSNWNKHHKKILLSISSLIAIGAAASITIGVIAVTILNIHARSSLSHSAAPLTLSAAHDFSRSPTNDPNCGKLVMLNGDADFATDANNLLNKEAEIGRGGFGVVYHTSLRDGRSVAIKKLTVSSLIKSREDFEREVKKLGKIRHRNLVALEGYYWTSSLQLLIYEYVSEGNLYKLLHEDNIIHFLSWRQRFDIVLGIAKGLAHLHHMNIIHYNLKSTNVLIDSSGQPRVADSGLVKLLPVIDHCVLSSKIQSALGYMAPEFACRTVKITEKCDVYGFGILVLEIVTGKIPVEYMEDDVVVLCDRVKRELEESRMEQCMDPRLQGNFPAEEAIPVLKLGLICASQVPSNRPDMNEVINILQLIQCPSDGQEELELDSNIL